MTIVAKPLMAARILGSAVVTMSQSACSTVVPFGKGQRYQHQIDEALAQYEA